MSELAVLERSGPEQSRLNDLLKDFQEWRLSKGLGNFSIKFVDDEEAWEITLGSELPTVLVYLSDIDADFYGEHAAVFVECQVGAVSESTDISKYLRFAGSEMVLSRVSLRTEGEEPLLVVEGACPFALVRFEFLEMMIQEVAAIGADLIDLAEGRIDDDEDDEEDGEEDDD
jgi:hypothetical protein